MRAHSCLADNVDCYCVAPVVLGEGAVVSMYSFLCTATKDYESTERATVAMPVQIEDHAWVCADAFIGPGVVVGRNAVVGARSTVVKDVEESVVVAGNPARVVKRRRPRSTGTRSCVDGRE